MQKWIWMTFVFSLAIASGACGRFGPANGAERIAEANPSAPIAEQRAQLREIVGDQIAQAERSANADKNELIAKEPYYYKEYSEYPQGAESADITLRESESRAAPYIADVRIDKIRYSTRLHRDKSDARVDQNFLRDTGRETITYELRGGYWTKVGTLFVAEKTEENINGEWVPTQEDVQRTVVVEQEKGWFGRTLDSITNIF